MKLIGTGNFSVGASATNVNPGANINVTVSVSNGAGRFTATSSNPAVVSVTSQPDWVNINGSSTFTVRANAVRNSHNQC